METKVKKIIGIDVSKLTIDVYDGKKSYQFKNNIKGFKQLLKKTSGHWSLCNGSNRELPYKISELSI